MIDVFLSAQLRSDKRCTEAAIVLEEYASDTEEAIVCLIEGSQWEEALRRVGFPLSLCLIEGSEWEGALRTVGFPLPLCVVLRAVIGRRPSEG
jgi:hypothetical protein